MMDSRRVNRVSDITSRIRELDEQIEKLTSLASEAANNRDFHVGVRFGVNKNVQGAESNTGRQRLSVFFGPPPQGGDPKYSWRVDIDLRSATALRVFQGFLDALTEEKEMLMDELDQTTE